MGPLRFVVWPYDSGRRAVGMGAGALRLAGALADLAAAVDEVAPVDEGEPEIRRVFELDRRLADTVRAASADGAVPVVLAGNCISCLGTVAGSGARAAVWFDAHADFDTPDDNVSGFLDVMGLSALTGGAWRALATSIPGFAPIEERDVVLAGVRDLERHQAKRLRASALTTVPGAVDADALTSALDALARRERRVYLHVDLDALDPSAGRANAYAAPGGASLETLLDAVDAVFDRFDLAAAAISAYDPALDGDDRVLGAARAIVERIAQRSAR